MVQEEFEDAKEDLQLPMQSLPIITDVSSNFNQGELYNSM